MNFTCLELRKGSTYEQVKFFDEFVSHYTEGDGWTRTVTNTYISLGLSRERCIKQYLEQGFMEVDND